MCEHLIHCLQKIYYQIQDVVYEYASLRGLLFDETKEEQKASFVWASRQTFQRKLLRNSSFFTFPFSRKMKRKPADNV